MTISVAVTISTNLETNESWPLFSQGGSRQVPSEGLAAVSVEWRSSDWNPGALNAEAKAGTAQVVAAIVDSLGVTLQILAVNEIPQPQSRIVLYRRLWKSMSVHRDVVIGEEVCIACDAGVRFAGIATIPKTATAWLSEMLWDFKHIVPLFFANPLSADERTAQQLAISAFPPDGCLADSSIVWRALVREVVSAGGFCARLLPSLVDRAVVLQIFSSDDLGVSVYDAVKDLRKVAKKEI